MVFERKELEVCIVLWNRVGLDLFLGSFFACVKFSRYGSLDRGRLQPRHATTVAGRGGTVCWDVVVGGCLAQGAVAGAGASSSLRSLRLAPDGRASATPPGALTASLRGRLISYVLIRYESSFVIIEPPRNTRQNKTTYRYRTCANLLESSTCLSHQPTHAAAAIEVHA
jgi:hypothetical protein